MHICTLKDKRLERQNNVKSPWGKVQTELLNKYNIQGHTVILFPVNLGNIDK